MCKGSKNAYMTVEASMIFPIIFGGILFTVYLGLYLYNVGVIKQVSYIAALRGSQLTQASSKQIELYVEEELEKLIKDKILGTGEIEKDIRISVNKIKVKIEMKMTVPFMEGIPWGKELWNIKSEVKVNRINPVDIIRGVRRINESKISE